MKNFYKYLMFGSVIAGLFIVFAVFNIALNVNAQTNADDNTMMNSIDQEKYQNVKNGLGAIMGKYGFVQSPPEISREDWTNMHGEIYDLMKENDVNPGTAMMYMFGGRMQKGNMMMNEGSW